MIFNYKKKLQQHLIYPTCAFDTISIFYIPRILHQCVKGSPKFTSVLIKNTSCFPGKQGIRLLVLHTLKPVPH